MREWEGVKIIMFNLMMTVFLHLQLPEVRDNRYVSSACLYSEGDDTGDSVSGDGDVLP